MTTFHRMFAIPVLFRLDRVISLPIPRPNPVPRPRAAHPAPARDTPSYNAWSNTRPLIRPGYTCPPSD